MSPFRSVPVDAEWASYSTASGGFRLDLLLGPPVRTLLFGSCARRPSGAAASRRHGVPQPLSLCVVRDCL
jgi:hypothetical protein